MDVTVLKRKRYVYLFASAASFLVLGLVYAWSLFATAARHHLRVGAERGEGYLHDLHGGVLRGRSHRGASAEASWRQGAILLSATLLVCGFAGTALLAPQGIWALYLCYGVLIGCGTGLGYNVAIATVTLWFPDRTGFASGVMFMGFGLGSLTLGTPRTPLSRQRGLPSP